MTLDEANLGRVVLIPARIIDDSPLEFAVVEFGGIFRTIVFRNTMKHMEVKTDHDQAQ